MPWLMSPIYESRAAGNLHKTSLKFDDGARCLVKRFLKHRLMIMAGDSINITHPCVAQEIQVSQPHCVRIKKRKENLTKLVWNMIESERWKIWWKASVLIVRPRKSTSSPRAFWYVYCSTRWKIHYLWIWCRRAYWFRVRLSQQSFPKRLIFHRRISFCNKFFRKA